MNFETPEMPEKELNTLLKWFKEKIGTEFENCETYAIFFDLDPVQFCLVEDKLRELINY